MVRTHMTDRDRMILLERVVMEPGLLDSLSDQELDLCLAELNVNVKKLIGGTAEIIETFSHRLEGTHLQEAIPRYRAVDGNKDLARRAIDYLVRARLSLTEIASSVSSTVSTISRIRSQTDYPVSESLANRLHLLVVKELQRAWTELAPIMRQKLIHAPVRIETCAGSETIVNEPVLEDLREVIAAALLDNLSLVETGSQPSLPKGIGAVLAEFNPRHYAATTKSEDQGAEQRNKLFVMVVRPSSDNDAKRALLHEIEHIAEIIRSELPRSERRSPVNSAY